MNWQQNLDTLTASVKAAVKQMRRDGTISMSRENFRQCVSTRGLDIRPDAFDRLLTEAIHNAHVHSFIH